MGMFSKTGKDKSNEVNTPFMFVCLTSKMNLNSCSKKHDGLLKVSPSAVVQVDDERLVSKLLKGLIVVAIHVAWKATELNS